MTQKIFQMLLPEKNTSSSNTLETDRTYFGEKNAKFTATTNYRIQIVKLITEYVLVIGDPSRSFQIFFFIVWSLSCHII